MEQQSPQIKICPHCRKEIDVLATKCPYCQSKLRIPSKGILMKPIPDGFSFVVGLFAFCVLVFLLFGNSNTSNQKQNNPASQNASSQPSTVATSEQTTLTYAPVPISTLIENADNPTFAHNNGGGESAPLASFVEVKGKVSKIFPGNWFLLQDPSGNMVVITVGGEPDASTKVKLIILGNSIVVDGIFIGSIKTFLNEGSLPPSISFMSSLPTSTPWLTW